MNLLVQKPMVAWARSHMDTSESSSHQRRSWSQVSLPTQYNGQKQDPVGALSGTLARLQANRFARELREGVKGVTKLLPTSVQEGECPSASITGTRILLCVAPFLLPLCEAPDSVWWYTCFSVVCSPQYAMAPSPSDVPPASSPNTAPTA